MALGEIGAILSGCVNEAVVFACEAYVFNILNSDPKMSECILQSGRTHPLGHPKVFKIMNSLKVDSI